MKVQNFDPKILNFVELYRILDHADLAADFRTRKSTTGFVVVLAGGLVSWMSKLQSTVALSTAEAETNARVEAVKQIMHFRLFMRELRMGQDGTSVVYEGNQAAIVR